MRTWETLKRRVKIFLKSCSWISSKSLTSHFLPTSSTFRREVTYNLRGIRNGTRFLWTSGSMISLRAWNFQNNNFGVALLVTKLESSCKSLWRIYLSSQRIEVLSKYKVKVLTTSSSQRSPPLICTLSTWWTLILARNCLTCGGK